MISQRYNFTSIQTVLSKFYRDLKDTSISQDDLIEWIGEAMGFMKMPQIQEEAVSFLEVKDHQTFLPKGFQAVIQLAKKRNTDSLHNCKCEVANECETKTVIDKICEEIVIPNIQTEENNFPFINCVPIIISFACPPNKTIFSIDFSTYLGGITNSFDAFLNDLASNPLPKTYSYFELQGYLKANNITITSVNVPSFGYI